MSTRYSRTLELEADLYGLLAHLYAEKQDAGAARAVLQRAASDPRLSPQERAGFARQLQGAR